MIRNSLAADSGRSDDGLVGRLVRLGNAGLSWTVLEKGLCFLIIVRAAAIWEEGRRAFARAIAY
jgi:hypothetical protein